MKIQDLLRKEVSSYRKPKPIDFNALITPTSQTTSKTEDNPYADLNNFLAQMASPRKESNTNSTPSANPLLPANKDQPITNSLLDAQKQTSPSSVVSQRAPNNPLLESQNNNRLLQGAQPASQNSLLNSQANLLLSQKGTQPFQKSNQNPLLIGAKEAAELAPTSKDHLQSSVNSKSEKMADTKSTKGILVPVTLTTSESEHSNDTDLFTSFMKDKNENEKEVPLDLLTVSTVAKSNSDDIEMISAKMKQTEISDSQPGEEPESKVVDTKSILRQRLIDKQNANTGM